MAEVGSAFVSIMPSAQGFGKTLDSQVGTQIESSGKKSGGRFTNAIGKTLKAGAIGVGATVGAGLGVAIAKGFSRLKAIDEARAKLEGLGNSTKTVDNIMGNALNSVRGTAFGLGDAATVAAGTVAAGVKPGRELEKTLKLVADSATIAGTDLGSMGAIFNKVAASNKIQGDTIAQLSDAGIPIIQLLGKELGVTAGEVTDLASKGKIDFKTFQAAMEGGLGGAAQKSGETFSGALANVGAALGRVGAGLLGGIFPKMAPLFQRVTTALGPLEAVAGKVGEVIGGALARGFQFVSDIAGRIDFAAIGSAFSTLAGQVTGRLLPALSNLGGAAAAGLAPLVSAVMSVLPGFLSLGKTIASNVIPAISSVVEFVVRFKEVFGALVGGIVAGVVVFKVYTTAVMLVRAVTAAWAATQAFLNAALLSNPLGIVVVAIGALVAGLIYAWRNSETFRNIVTTAWNGVRAAAVAVFGFIGPYVRRAITLIRAVAARVLPLVAAGFRTYFNAARAVVSTVMRVIVTSVRVGVGVIRAVVRTVSAVVGFFKSAFDRARSAVASAFDRIKAAVKSGVNKSVDFVKELPGKAAAAVAGGAGGMFRAGSALIQGLVDGVAAKIGAAVQKVRDGLAQIKGLLPGSPIKWGPLKSWNNGGAGKRLMEMLAKGLGYTKPVDAAMQRLTSRMSVGNLTADVRTTTTGLAESAIGGGSSLAALGSVRLVLEDGRELNAWFEDSYDDMEALNR